MHCRVVELFIGISCACMPAFSKMIHYHLPTLQKIRSVFSSHFTSLRFSKSGGTTGHSGFSQSDSHSQNADGKTTRGPYRHLEVEMFPPGGVAPQPAYDFGQPRSVQTFITKGWSKGASDDQIHLTHEIEQQQTRTR